MTAGIECDLCVIGAGAGGLSVAVGAAQLGARTVLFERGAMGGDCLNYGCVPSKALLAAAHAAHTSRHSSHLGVAATAGTVDFAAVMRHVHGVIAQIAPHDSVERLEGLGVRVIRAHATFTGRNEISGGGLTVRARRCVIATGSSAVQPPIAGLEGLGALTHETLFALTERPEHLLILGGGPIGVEMAQAFVRLGSRVTIFERATLLPRDDPEFAALLREQLRSEGVTVYEHAAVSALTRAGTSLQVRCADGLEVHGSHLLVAAGRAPRIDGLGLERAGVAYGPHGIIVDARLRTTNRRIYALGDVLGPPQFTHVAGYQAGIVIRNALFRLPARVDYRALPWVTYTDPELAHVGMTEREARERHGSGVQVVRADFAANDRARAEGVARGGIQVITDRRGRVLGVDLLGPHAGELIGLWGLAITRRLRLGALSGVIFPYPTLGEIAKASASALLAPKLFSPGPRRLVRLLLRLP